MKRIVRFYSLGFRLFLGLLFSTALISQWGCTTVQPLMIADDVQVTGPLHQIPVRVTDRDMGGHLRIIPHIAFMQQRSINGAADLNNGTDLTQYGIYDSTNNVRWNLPSYVAGLSLDYGLSKSVSLSVGGTYANVSGRESLEWDAGIALCFQDPNLGGRLEAGVQWQDINYRTLLDRFDEEYNWNTGANTVTYLYSIERYGKFQTGNFYCSFTLNSRFSGSPVNVFGRVGYGVTSVLSNEMLKLNEEGDISTSIGFLNVTPGVCFNITRWNRLVLGCDFISPVGMSSSSPRWLVVPVAQFAFTI